MTNYPTRVDTIDLRQWGTIQFKQWLHNGPLAFSEDGVTRLSKFIPPGSLAIDIGAYTGDTAIPMALCVGDKGKVVAFEPGPASWEFLQDNVKLNPRLRISAHHLAITSEPGEYTFHYVDQGFINGGLSTAISAGPDGCGNSYKAKVQGVNLTQFLKDCYGDWIDKLRYVKIDTEGYDKEILKANGAFFMQYRPVIEVEVYPFLNDVERTDLMESIVELSYHWEVPNSQFWLPAPAVVNVLCFPNS